jgi:hypothetical protein
MGCRGKDAASSARKAVVERRDGHAPRRHRNVAGDAVKLMRLLILSLVRAIVSFMSKGL